MEPPFPEYDADEKREPKPAPAATPTRLRDVSVRLLIPNLITLGAICAGLTGVRLAVEGRFELAIVAVVFAAVLDGLDGRAARCNFGFPTIFLTLKYPGYCEMRMQ